MIDITLLGTGGMLPLPERGLTALYVRLEGRAVLIDCGEGTQTAIRRAALRFKPIDVILFTHLHADHISGLPGLLLTMGNEGRTEPLMLYGPRGLKDTVDALCIIVPELPFPVECQELDPRQSHRFCCIGLQVDAFPGEHGIPCLGYCLNLDRRGKFDPQAAKDKGIPVSLWSRLQKGEALEGFTPEDVLGTPRPGIRLLYATDTRPVNAIVHYGEGADLMILEGMFGDPDKQARALASHHMMMQEAALLAARAKAKELWLTHFSPANPTPEDYAEELQAIFPHTVIPKDGMTATVRFPEE